MKKLLLAALLGAAMLFGTAQAQTVCQNACQTQTTQCQNAKAQCQKAKAECQNAKAECQQAKAQCAKPCNNVCKDCKDCKNCKNCKDCKDCKKCTNKANCNKACVKANECTAKAKK